MKKYSLEYSLWRESKKKIEGLAPEDVFLSVEYCWKTIIITISISLAVTNKKLEKYDTDGD